MNEKYANIYGEHVEFISNMLFNSFGLILEIPEPRKEETIDSNTKTENKRALSTASEGSNKNSGLNPIKRPNLPDTSKKCYQLSKGDPTTRPIIKKKVQHVAKDLVVDATLSPTLKKKNHPAISQMLRYRKFDNINKAFTAAIAEEKILRLTYKENFVRYRNCGRTNHTTTNCYKNNYCNPLTHRYNNFRSVHFNQAPSNFLSQPCQDSQFRYCKHCGQSLEECRKRQYNNAHRSNQQVGPLNTNRVRQPEYRTTNQEQNNNTRTVNFYQSNFPIASQLPNSPISIKQSIEEFCKIEATVQQPQNVTMIATNKMNKASKTLVKSKQIFIHQ
ncbi:hypothetical protein WN51_09011 [Melipona quadrifasciata]|uniref:Uncharacterized protein n=1 Tax=Melipona quadrifasciata TaxID=166423 RepID=A0A0M9A9R2_9HYME|nr:hypothetical protein WN51_09011 [Melipona quadrifasciata]